MMLGFDCNCKLSYELAKKFKTDGYEFAMRYVGRLKQASIDIDKTELQDILRAGLKLGIVQHCPPKPGILPSKELGVEYGKNAAIFSKESGYKQGCIVYLDLEDVNADYKKRQSDIIAFCNAWYDEVKAAGYTPGVYVGFNMWLTDDELYSKLKFQHYWRSGSNVPDVTKRGYEMFQKEWLTVNGIQIDTNEATGDRLGNMPVFMEAEKVLLHTISVYSDGSIEVKEV
jgi:hypothetical protein